MKQINTEEIAKDILNAMENCRRNKCWPNTSCGECIYYNGDAEKCAPRLMKDAESLIRHLLHEKVKQKDKKEEIKRYLNRMYGTDLMLIEKICKEG